MEDIGLILLIVASVNMVMELVFTTWDRRDGGRRTDERENKKSNWRIFFLLIYFGLGMFMVSEVF